MALPEPGLPTPKLLRESTDLTFSSTFTSSSTRSFSYTPNTVTFTRTRTRLPANKPKYRILHQPLFRNSLLAGVGYLELANAADFAANVWNGIPVPLHAKILMAIGGPCALCMTLVAARDMYLSAANVRLLRQERTFLADSTSTGASSADHTSDGSHKPTPPSSERSTIDKLNEYKHGVNTREVLTEVIDRILMDLLMGVGALLVGIGTLLAIWGADRTIYRASNLLSGYVGNGLAAGFGLVNAIWSAYLVWRFQRCWKACAAAAAAAAAEEEAEEKISRDKKHELPASLKTKLRARMRALQLHAVVNGVNGVVAGAASMVTATMWYGYVVLVPCIVSLILLNVFWRARLGYDRSLGTFSSTGFDAELCTTATATAAENPVRTTITEDDPATDHPEGAQSTPDALLAHHKEDIDRDSPNEDALSILLTELAYVSEMHRALLHTTTDLQHNDDSSHQETETETRILRTLQLLPITTLTPTTLLAFITHHNLWESFCVWLIESQSGPSLLKRVWNILRLRRRQSTTTRTTAEELDAILGLGIDTNPNAVSPLPTSAASQGGEELAAPAAAAAAEVTLLHPEDLLTRCKDPTLLVRKMKAFLVGNVTRCFAYRERYLLEMVGYAIWKESLANPGDCD
ncbi:hypothetical protein ASPACDRAFT_1858109 [Aspergillus aculeatus ATCC 16872]|uniref:Integral membrane protein n=1 Tax=Aspergillus aculeatus (strain ATCC 16872 / CBS 172.66 / WB 5094) TaxID=690307 RepID=A0A1L9WPL3_ASPA1|nr:uncharacterized protein ASPACDRAFT_1858109 [Aspergillus aculeatus ATCC 16872]OJJ98094.1 hypothetical protein ASPACDRAFT_1858109 [Aspergillus aculeatus ATCC 16872]